MGGKTPAEGVIFPHQDGFLPHQLSIAPSGETTNPIGHANEGIKYG
ncbi:hypothetical protein [Priestia megaterium]|jgi:hypothetical protein|nr:hypothetical protein [Priestia megaterium]MED4252949.1 hypothetical protein [Priestia megaterium]